MEIDVYKGLKYCGNDDKKYTAVLKDFFLTSDEEKKKIRTYAIEKNIDMYLNEVHSLKGIARNIGADALADIAYEHEIMSRQGNIEYIQSHVENLLDCWQGVLYDIEDYVGKEHLIDDVEIVSNGLSLSDNEVIETAEESIALLRAFESDEAERTLKGLLCYEMADEERAVIMEAYRLTRDFEYQSAIETLARL